MSTWCATYRAPGRSELDLEAEIPKGKTNKRQRSNLPTVVELPEVVSALIFDLEKNNLKESQVGFCPYLKKKN